MKLYIIFIIMLLHTVMVCSKDLVIHRTDAETSVELKNYPANHKMGVKCPVNRIPRGWGAYRGAGEAIWGTSTNEAHSGKSSAFLTFKNWHLDKKSNREQASFALLIGESNGYTGNHAIPVKPNTDYSFSFWLKGNISFVSISVQGWNRAGKRVFIQARRVRRNGLGIRKRRGITVNPNPDKWEKFTGEFTTPEDSSAIVVKIAFNNPVLLSPGQTIYADDAVVKQLPD